MKQGLIFSLLAILMMPTAHASMDEATRERLIEKFTKVYQQIADEEEAKVNVTLRLGDMLAEKGRDLANKELGEGCGVCTAGDEPRKQALRYYSEAVGFLKDDRKASVQLQMGHLQELLALELDAIKSYESVFKNAKNEKLTAEANFSLGELYFKKRNFPLAASYFLKVMNASDGVGRKGLSAYRKAWCEFNAGNYSKGTNELVTILQSPKFLTRSADTGVVSVDEEFKDEITRDLVVFMVKRGYQANDFDVIYKLGKDDTKIDHLTNFAEELERLGEVNNSIEVWNKLLGKLKDPIQKWGGQVRYANLLRENKKIEDSLKAFDRALSFGAGQDSCQTDTCKEIRLRERKYVLDWHNSIKKNPTEDLSKAYAIYNRYNKNEPDMMYWAAEIDLTLKKPKEAFTGFAKTVEIYPKAQAEDEKKQKELAQMYEASLLKRIEIAEDQKLPELAKVYEAYLAGSKDKAQDVKVKYQLARLAYDNKDYIKAFNQFKDFAIKTKSTDAEDVKLKEQAADLALDSLVLAKRDDLMISAAEELSEALPQKSAEYQGIVRKAVINQSLELAQDNGGKAQAGSKKALDLLKKADFSGATEQEKEVILKNKIILAEQMGQISEAIGYVNQYLTLPKLSKENQQFAYTKKAWLSELVFDFSGALEATKNIESLKEPARTLQLALLTDLAGGDSSVLFKEYIEKNPKAAESPEMALDLIKKSNAAWAEFNKYKTVLESNPALWKDALLVSYEQNPSLPELAKVLKWNETDKKFRVEILQTQMIKPEIATRAQALAAMAVDTEDQNKMGKDIQARTKAIKDYEAFVADILKADIWFGQVYALDVLAKESQRFYEEVMSLPIPEELTPEEQNQYMNLLAQSASPYQAKNQQITTKLAEIWNEKKAVKSVFSELGKQPKWVQNLWVKEYQDLAGVAPKEFNTFVASEVGKFQGAEVVVAKKSADVPLKDMMKVRSKVMAEPFNKGVLGQLLDIEKQRKQDKMVIYLEQRLSKIDQLKGGVTK
ncbi:MAG: tetratricopeptide repeat protein [Bdellovibrionaceae bacterium]|nr:tetratricopeptide repeat protein [Pseudobdellovibrionaceae bacterium]